MIFQKPSGEEQLGLERLRRFQESRKAYKQVLAVREDIDRLHDDALVKYEAAKKALRREAES